MTYYHINQLTGIGYEVLLDAVTSDLIVWFDDGWMWGIRPGCGTKAYKLATEGEQHIETRVAA